MRRLLGKYKKIARYNAGEHEFHWFNGSNILFRYLMTDKDLDNFQGTEADVIFIDEATHHEEKVFKVIVACLRGVNNFPKRVYLTCNPTGKGLQWMKRLFIDRDFHDDENPDDYVFIQSLVTDNTALMRAQPGYIKQLEALPPKLRRAWLEGYWDTYEGQFFTEFVNNPDNYKSRQYTHVIEPFDIPHSWKRLRSYDHGYAKPFSVGWWALSPDNILYRILQMYGCRKDEPDVGIRWIPREIFAEVQRVEREHPYLKGHKITGVADTQIWDGSDRGVSVADTAATFGIHFDKAEKARIPGWLQVHYRLAFDENGYPMMYIFNTCDAFIRTIPSLVHSETIPEDLDTKQEDHIADETRYLCMSNPIAPREHLPAPQIPEYDPLYLHRDKYKTERKRYRF
jgi:hypothetical protein